MNEHKESQVNGIKQQEIPQLNETTGVSFDFRNNYVALMGFLSPGGIEELRSFIKNMNFVMKKYEEYFPSSKYKNVVNEKNQSAVKRIDELVESFNKKVKEDALTEKDFLAICSELETLVTGE